MIALNSECILVERVPDQWEPFFPGDITQEMLGIEADPDYFQGAVGAVFTYINRDSYLGKVTLTALSDLVSAALVTPPGKLLRSVNLMEIIPAESLYGELSFLQKLHSILQSLISCNADLILLNGIKDCTLTCMHRKRWGKAPQSFANSVIQFINDFSRTNSFKTNILVIQS